MGCFLGACFSPASDSDHLEAAYGEFQQEAREMMPDYQPVTVNTDGWSATQQAWRKLFPSITVLLCFLHSVLGIQKSCRRDAVLFNQLTTKLWDIYHKPTLRHFAQSLRRLRDWAATTVLPDKIHEKLTKLIKHAPNFKQHFDYPGAYRTSNNLDRLMNYQDRILYSMQYFHGSQASAQQALRAMALIWNFHPYGRRAQAKRRKANEAISASPFEDLNGFRYHNHWLKNLLIAASLNGRHCGNYVSRKLVEN